VSVKWFVEIIVADLPLQTQRDVKKFTGEDTVSFVQEISKKGLDHPVECSYQTNKKQEIKSWLL
jgi:hypothetical protein